MKPNTPNNSNEEKRFACDNWDKPEIRTKRRGTDHSTLKRKVITTGKAVIPAPYTIDQAVKYLRQGNIVELSDGSGQSFIMLVPIASADCKSILVAAKAMTPLSQCMTDKKPVVVQGKGKSRKDVSQDEVQKLVEEQAERFEQRISVTPDTVVACPKCGFEFRVGKQLK